MADMKFDPTIRQTIPVIADTTLPKLAPTFVAGEGADGHGVFCGWSGLGDMTRADLVDLATTCELPIAWLPEPKDPSAQLSRAIRGIVGNAYAAQCIAKRGGWILTSKQPDGETLPKPGETYGEVVLVATLKREKIEGQDPIVTLEIDTSIESLGAALRAAYDDAIGTERYAASDITQWLSRVFRDELDAVRYGGIWYVPRRYRTIAEMIVAVFSTRWGRNWMSPPVPVATGAQLATGFAIALQGEVDDVCAEFARLREQARANGKPDIGHRGAESVMVRLRRVGERIAGYEDCLTEDQATECRSRLHDAMVDLDGILGAADFNAEWTAIVKSRAERQRDNMITTGIVQGFIALRRFAAHWIEELYPERIALAERAARDAADTANRLALANGEIEL